MTDSRDCITRAFDVPAVGSKEAGLCKSLGFDVSANNNILVGYAAGMATDQLPKGYRVVRVVVVARYSPEGTT
jgi:hypothetical protein